MTKELSGQSRFRLKSIPDREFSSPNGGGEVLGAALIDGELQITPAPPMGKQLTPGKVGIGVAQTF